MIIIPFVQGLYHENMIKCRITRWESDNILKSMNTDTWENQVVMRSEHTGQYRQFDYLFKCPCTYADGRTRYIYYSETLDKFLHIDIIPH